MTPNDDNTSHLAESQIDRQLRRGEGDHGDLTQKIGRGDPRVTSFINWVWAAIGSFAVMVGYGVYNKLSSINDTLIQAVSDIKNQGAQVADLKGEVRDLRNAQTSMQRQIDSLEGKTLRGIEEMKREK